MKKFKQQRICILTAIFLSSLFSCSQTKICGPRENNSNKIEFHICEDILNKDTLDYSWFEKLPEPYSSDHWLGGYDTIAFFLPNDYEIIEASQSYLIVPSIWAKYGDEVTQYVTFHDLKIHCKNPKFLKVDNNILIKGFDIDEKLLTELYFKNKKHLSKDELLMSLKKQYDASALQISEMPVNESITASDKKKWFNDNQHEKHIYEGYLNNYTNWETAPRNEFFIKDGSELPREQFDLLAVVRYLTLTIKIGENKHKKTIVYKPVYGN